MARKYTRGTGKTGRRNKNAEKQETKIRQAERLKLIVGWRISGYTHEEIADFLPEAGFQKITPRAVALIVQKEIVNRPAELVEEYRRVMLAQAGQMLVPFLEKAIGGDGFAVGTVLQLQERQAKLLGLDLSPKRISSGDASDPQAQQSQAKTSIAAKLAKMSENLAKSPVIDAVAMPAMIEVEPKGDG